VGNPPGATIVPTAVPGPAVTATGPGPVQGRPVNEFLPNGVPSIVVLGAGETGAGGSWLTVFPLSLGLVVFPLSIGLLVFCADAVVIVTVRTRLGRSVGYDLRSWSEVLRRMRTFNRVEILVDRLEAHNMLARRFLPSDQIRGSHARIGGKGASESVCLSQSDHGVPLRYWSDTQRCRVRHRQASTRHVWGTRQSRRCRIPTALLRVAPAMWRLFQLSIMFVIGLMPESANDNSPLPAALIISYVAGELSPPPKASWRSEGPIRCSQSAWCRPHHAQTTALWGRQM
jgi:hypothetical protein